MALIKCPECGNQVSDSAVTCPQCGFGIASYAYKQKEIAKIEKEAADEAYKYTKEVMAHRAKAEQEEANRRVRQMEANYKSAVSADPASSVAAAQTVRDTLRNMNIDEDAMEYYLEDLDNRAQAQKQVNSEMSKGQKIVLLIACLLVVVILACLALK